MSSILTEWIKEELYPTLFHHIDTVFPEHDFKPFPGGWRSKTYLSGEPHLHRADKTVITKNAPGLILEQGGENRSLIDYVIQRDSSDFITGVSLLAEKAGLQLPQSNTSDREEYQQHKEKATILEVCNSYFVWCLQEAKGAEPVRKYLKGRGYSAEFIATMDLGYIPSQKQLFTYLTGKGYSLELIGEAVKIQTDTRIGSTHTLTIAYRSGGVLKGFKFRTIGEAIPKYLNSSGLDIKSGFFNLTAIKGAKDLVIVEGELDSLNAIFNGIENVVAATGSSISPDQVRGAIKKGVKSVTLCFDTEPGKEETTVSHVNQAIQIILAEGVDKVYVATLTDLGNGKTDPDRVINESGVESLKESIASAVSYYSYFLQNILNKYAKIQGAEGLNDRQIDNLIEEIQETASKIENIVHRDRYLTEFTRREEVKALGVTQALLEEVTNRLITDRAKDFQVKEVRKLHEKVGLLLDKGNSVAALSIWESGVKEITLKNAINEPGKALTQLTRAGLKERLANKPDSIKSGYTLNDGKKDQEILLPAGALSFFTAPTGHGKTRFLLNMANNIVLSDLGKKVYFFSFEENADPILIKAFNIYQNSQVGLNNMITLESYFKDKTRDIGPEDLAHLKRKDQQFFTELIDSRRLNIHHTGMNVTELSNTIRQLHEKNEISAVFIDYIQLIRVETGKFKTNSRQEEMKEICIELNNLAVDTGLPITLGAQFNREVTKATDMHPTKIGEAGDIERIASLIVGFFDNNTDIEVPDTTKYYNRIKTLKGPTLFTRVMKNRIGPTGAEGNISYDGNTGKMESKSSQSHIF